MLYSNDFNQHKNIFKFPLKSVQMPTAVAFYIWDNMVSDSTVLLTERHMTHTSCTIRFYGALPVSLLRVIYVLWKLVLTVTEIKAPTKCLVCILVKMLQGL